MKYDLLHIQGKPYVLVPLHDYRAMSTSKNEESPLPPAILDQLAANQSSAVKILRNYRGLTQKDLAERARISRPYLTEIETGKKDGSIRAIKSLAEALNVGIEILTA